MQRLICKAAELADGGEGVRFSVSASGCSLSAFVLRWQGRVYAYGNHCPHVGLELDWNPGRFLDAEGQFLICAAHGAMFEPDTGLCVGGPCHGKSLQHLTVIERDGNIYIEAE